MNYYPHHIGDFAKDTAHLTMIEEGAYRRMLDLYYTSERPLPLDRKGLYRLVRARSVIERAAVDTVLQEFFKETGTGWTQGRCDAEIAKAQAKSDAAKQSAGMRWHSERIARPDANALPAASEGNAPNNQEPIANSQKPEREARSQGSRLPPEWALPEEWKAWAMQSEGWDQRKTLAVAEQFRDHWHAKAGKDARKVEWEATWRNWVRKQKDFAPKGNGHDPAPVTVGCSMCHKPILGAMVKTGSGPAHMDCWEKR